MKKGEYAGGPITGAWRDEEERNAIGVGAGRGGWGNGVIGWTRFDFMMEIGCRGAEWMAFVTNVLLFLY